jgi:hypothetical protein
MNMTSEETMTVSSISKKMLGGDEISGRGEMIEEKTAISTRDQILVGVSSKLETTCIRGNHAVHIGIMADIESKGNTKNDAIESNRDFVSCRLELICFVAFVEQA